MSVARESSTSDPYHHGNLRAALLDSALDVLIEYGVAGFSMREAARRAGVSQSAPKHHFGDTRGLLAALAARGYRELCERLEAVPLTGRDTRKRVTDLAMTYVGYAEQNRAVFDLMWRTSQFDIDEPDVHEQKHRALRALHRGLHGPHAQLPDGDTDPLLAPSYAVWSLTHGYATLALEGAIHHDQPDLMTGGLLPALLRLLDI